MTVGGRINPSDVDEVLSVLDAAHERVSGVLFRLDAHPRLELLRGGGLAGTTARIAREVPAALPALWRRFEVLGRYLDRIREIRADRVWLRGRDRVELTRLLYGKTVPVDLAGAPLPDQAPLPGGAPVRPARRLTLKEFAHELEHICTRYLRRLDRLDKAVGQVVDEVVALEARLTRAQARAAGLGVAEADDPVVAELTAARAALDRLRHQALADPLAPDRATRLGTRPFTGALDAAQVKLSELARIRDRSPERLAKLRERVDEVAAAEAAAAAAREAVLQKVAEPELPAAPPGADQLRRRLSTLEELAREGQWPRFARETAQVEEAGVVAYRQARGLRAEADRLLERRAELRTRLGGLAAMAAGPGDAAPPELSAALAEATRLLDTEPCDLPAADRAAKRLRRLLGELAGRSPQATTAAAPRPDRTGEAT